MAGDPLGEAPLGTTYNGFSGPPAPERPPTGLARLLRERTKEIVLGGVTLALVLGLGAGLWARPNLDADGQARPPVRADTAEQVRILLNKSQPVAAPIAAAPRLEVLSPAQAAAAPRATPAPVQRLARAGPVRIEPPAADPAPEEDDVLDCRRPANRYEARMCRDLAAEEDTRRGPPPEVDVWDGPPEGFE